MVAQHLSIGSLQHLGSGRGDATVPGEKPSPVWSSCLSKGDIGGNTLTFSSGPEYKQTNSIESSRGGVCSCPPGPQWPSVCRKLVCGRQWVQGELLKYLEIFDF